MPHPTGRQIAVTAGCVLAVVTLAVGAYGLVRGPDPTPTTPPQRPDATSKGSVPHTTAAPALEVRSLPDTTDPLTYARAVATSLFDWDTTLGFAPSDYTAAVLADADPTGEETTGLLGDVAAYLPTVEQWLDLSVLGVRQSIEIHDAAVPQSWSDAVRQAHGQLRPGTTAVTLTGTRHRSGVWDDEDVKSEHPVSFTVFVACQPSFDRCHLLRLSQLDNPLR